MIRSVGAWRILQTADERLGARSKSHANPGTRKNVKAKKQTILDSSKLRNNEVRQKVPSLGKTNNKNRNQLKGTRMSPLPENRENIWTLLIESAGFRSHRRRFFAFRNILASQPLPPTVFLRKS